MPIQKLDQDNKIDSLKQIIEQTAMIASANK